MLSLLVDLESDDLLLKLFWRPWAVDLLWMFWFEARRPIGLNGSPSACTTGLKTGSRSWLAERVGGRRWGWFWSGPSVDHMLRYITEPDRPTITPPPPDWTKPDLTGPVKPVLVNLCEIGNHTRYGVDLGAVLIQKRCHRCARSLCHLLHWRRNAEFFSN